MSMLLDFKDLVQKNLFAILGFLIIVASIFGIVQFSSSTILPALDAQSKLAAQVNDARNALVDARKNQNEPVANVQARLSSAQTKLDSSLGYFLTDAQVNAFVNSLYQSAGESNVKITQVETLINNLQLTLTPTRVAPTPTRAVPTLIPTQASSGATTPTQSARPITPTTQLSPTKNVTALAPTSSASKDDLSARIVRLQAQGESRQLLDFVSRIKELSAKAIFVNSIAIAGDEKQATLNLELAIYVAPFALTSGSGSTSLQSSTGSKSAALAVPPTSLPTATPLPMPMFTFTPPPASPTLSPTAVPFQRYSIHVVVAGETINTIARQYGISVDAIRAANRMTSDEIRLAQQLLIPIR